MKRCFVIMPFSETTGTHTEEYWTKFFDDFIAEGLRAHGYKAHRSTASLNNITRDIMIELAYSDLVLAVLTDNNANVFYELGVRHGLHRGTILILEKGARPPFDVGHHGILFYHPDNLEHFKQELKARIMAGEKLQEHNPVNECIPCLEIAEKINLAVAVRDACTKIIKKRLKAGINKPFDERLKVPLLRIRTMQKEWDKRGELDFKQVSVVVCSSNWMNEKLVLHAYEATQGSESNTWWCDELLDGNSLFHEKIKGDPTGIRIVQIKGRQGRLTAVAYETVAVPPDRHCVVVAEAHFQQQ